MLGWGYSGVLVTSQGRFVALAHVPERCLAQGYCDAMLSTDNRTPALFGAMHDADSVVNIVHALGFCTDRREISPAKRRDDWAVVDCVCVVRNGCVGAACVGIDAGTGV
jgi:hypothetical protein